MLKLEIFKYNKATKEVLDSSPVRLGARQSTAIVWDNRDITNKWLLIRVEGARKQGSSSLDQISRFDQKKKQLKKHKLFNQKIWSKAEPKPRTIQVYTVLKVNQLSTKILSIMQLELDPTMAKKKADKAKTKYSYDSDEDEYVYT